MLSHISLHVDGLSLTDSGLCQIPAASIVCIQTLLHCMQILRKSSKVTGTGTAPWWGKLRRGLARSHAQSLSSSRCHLSMHLASAHPCMMMHLKWMPMGASEGFAALKQDVQDTNSRCSCKYSAFLLNYVVCHMRIDGLTCG